MGRTVGGEVVASTEVPPPEVSPTLGAAAAVVASAPPPVVSKLAPHQKALPQGNVPIHAADEFGTVITHAQLPSDKTLNERDICDLEMLLMGAFAPLSGYLSFPEYISVLSTRRLPNGAVWPMPILLPLNKSDLSLPPAITETSHAEAKENLPVALDVPPVAGQVIKLRNNVGTILAEIAVEDCYEPVLAKQMSAVLGTTEPSHPYVKYLQENHTNCVYVGGPIRAVHPIIHFDFKELRSTPAEIRAKLEKEGRDTVVGFQTRNPMHRSHYELTKQAVKVTSDSNDKRPVHLLLTPACGPTQPGDVKYHVRVRCYKKILPFYARDGITCDLVLLPLAMRMAGPVEALWHALIRRNFGCTHFIVGRDHAGPSTVKADGSKFYSPYAAHELLRSLENEIGIKPVFGSNMLYLGEEAGGYVQEDKVPAGVASQEISGTAFRRMLECRLPVPEWYSFAPVIEELQTFYKKRSDTGLCLYFTGLPCSGKSTLANAVEAALQERESETRAVTVLDADIIRTHLSKGLGFSRLDRQLNVRRIGYVASEIVKHGGVCIVANIAPYEEDRQFNRKLVGPGYVEVYVSTPLEICEQRDVKELYKKARAGVIKQFTGISDPYEIPVAPELIINSSTDILGKVDSVIKYLLKESYIV